MKIRWIVFLSFIMLISCSSIASAQFAKSGAMIPCKMTNYQFKTTTLLLPLDWKPTNMRWQLRDPSGKVVYWIDTPIDSVSTVSSGYEGINHYTVWSVTDDSGFIKVPAFAQDGEWTLTARFYDKLFGIWDFRQDTDKLYDVTVKDSQPWDSLNAPIYWSFDIPIIGDMAFATPDLIYMVGIIIGLIILILNVKMLFSKRETHAR